MDDASSDGTLEAAEAHQAEDSRIKVFVMAENQGAAFCRNFATKKSKNIDFNRGNIGIRKLKPTQNLTFKKLPKDAIDRL